MAQYSRNLCCLYIVVIRGSTAQYSRNLCCLLSSNRDLIIEQLQAEKHALDGKYQHSCVQGYCASVGGAIVM